jgi:hypothetical protein
MVSNGGKQPRFKGGNNLLFSSSCDSYKGMMMTGGISSFPNNKLYSHFVYARRILLFLSQVQKRGGSRTFYHFHSAVMHLK